MRSWVVEIQDYTMIFGARGKIHTHERVKVTIMTSWKAVSGDCACETARGRVELRSQC